MKWGFRVTILLFVLISLVSACGPSASDASVQGTLDAISAYVRQTSTAVAFANQDPNAAIQTAQADATTQAQAIASTQAAQDVVSADDQAATAKAVGPILGELPKYGVDPSAGHVGWIHPPVSLEVQGFMQYDYVNYFISTLASDFVVSADITWDAIGSAAGCGFVMRSDGNKRALNQYLAILTRVASGHVLFGTMAKGEVVTGQDIYAYGLDPAFDWQNKATNRFTVVGRGNRFSIYTNGTLIGEIDPSAPPVLNLPKEPEKPLDTSNAESMASYLLRKTEYDAVVEQMKADFRARQKAFKNADTVFERGFVAMVALSQSGRKAVCQFDNAWLWLMD